jgi:hypothetical protein
MRRAALALAAAAAGAKEPRTEHGRPYPETKAECGVVMFGTGDDYIQYSARNAQRIAALAVGSGWCAAQPDLDRVPVVYFHDNKKADALVRKGLGGAEPRFELFYLGTRAKPRMAKFEALPGTKRWARDYKWLRPQTFARSPFSTTLNMDGDAVPCGARLVEAFRAFAESKAAVAGLWHVGASYSGLNTGFMAWDKEKAAPLLAAWADGMRSAILANRTIRHDQPSLAAALNATRGVSVLRFSEANVCRVCRRKDTTSHCASTCPSDSCWVDHRDWGPKYNKAGIDGIAKVDGQSKWKLPPERVGGDRFA